jgi:FO synthase subunit 2
MATPSRVRPNVPREQFAFEYRPETDQSFENALAKARSGERLSVADGVELLVTGTDRTGIDLERKELVLEAADRRRAEVVGDEVTFVANLNNNITTACNTGCLFCNFKDRSEQFLEDSNADHGGFTKTTEESRRIVAEAVDRGIYEVTSVSGLHPAFALDDDHRALLEASDRGDLNYKSPDRYEVDPGTYVEQMRAMSVDDLHVHSMTPEEGYHARRGTDWSYEEVYGRLAEAGLDSVPGTAAEILVDEVRDVICPGKIDTGEWVRAIEAAANVGLPTTATVMYGHVENERHRVEHLDVIRRLQDRTDNITEFVPLSFIHPDTPLHDRGMVETGANVHEDELMIAVSRLYLDNIKHIQSSWVKYGDEQGLKMLSCGADDFMGTILSEEITKRAGGDYGEARSVAEYVEMISAVGRVPVERSTDYTERRRVDPDDTPHGPELGPHADGTPLVE